MFAKWLKFNSNIEIEFKKKTFSDQFCTFVFLRTEQSNCQVLKVGKEGWNLFISSNKQRLPPSGTRYTKWRFVGEILLCPFSEGKVQTGRTSRNNWDCWLSFLRGRENRNQVHKGRQSDFTRQGLTFLL